MTKIDKDFVVSMHYTLTDDTKAVLDKSESDDPLLYLHGHGQIIPGLENALLGKKVGDKLSVSVKPADGYGEYDAELTSEVKRKQFPKNAKLEVGEMFEFSNSEGHPVIVRIVGVDAENVKVDANHPLAGKNLHFEVEITEVRPATKTELEHGHAHGGDGHHH